MTLKQALEQADLTPNCVGGHDTVLAAEVRRLHALLAETISHVSVPSHYITSGAPILPTIADELFKAGRLDASESLANKLFAALSNP